MKLVPYVPPSWIPEWLPVPSHRFNLAQLPTRVEEWPLAPDLYIKRDDYTASEMSGNKIRKLEFLLAAAVQGGCDSCVTVGGIQSNHCRATAVAARRVGLEPHLILRADQRDDVGLEGNLMLSRLVGAKVHLVSPAEYQERGAPSLVEEVTDSLVKEGRKPYAFSSGGSNPLGTWGYVQAIAELEDEWDRIYFACGSGGTAAGLALGIQLSGMRAELVGLCVDDSPNFFYDKLDDIYAEMTPSFPLKSRDMLRLVQCVGDGYAVSTDSELDFILDTAQSTGVVLDPVYSGKAALGMVGDLQPGTRALFIHTGGHLGLYSKQNQLRRALERRSKNGG